MGHEPNLVSAPVGHRAPAAIRTIEPRRPLKWLTRARLAAALGALALALVAAYAVEAMHQARHDLAGPTQEQTVSAVATAAIGLFLEQRWGELSSRYAAGSTFKEAASGVQRTGSAAIINVLKDWHARYADLRGMIMSTHVRSDRALFHMAWTGRLKRPARAAGGALLPRGTVVTLSSQVLIRMRDSKIAATEHSYNPAELARQVTPASARRRGG